MHTTLFPNLKPPCFGSCPNLTIKELMSLCWHGTEATDRVTGAVQQQFRTDWNNTHFVSLRLGPQPGQALPNDWFTWHCCQQEFWFCAWLILISAIASPCLCNEGALYYDHCEQLNPVTPTKPRRHPGAGHDNSEFRMPKILNVSPIQMGHSVRKGGR